MIFNCSVFAVNRHTGEIAYMLVRACQLIKKCCLSAVLVTRKGKSYDCPFRYLLSPFQCCILFSIIFSYSGMVNLRSSFVVTSVFVCIMYIGKFYSRSIVFAQRKLIPAHPQFQRVSHRSHLHKRYFRSRCKPHVKDVFSQ